MKKVRLGKTELMVTKPALGCLPIQRRSMADALKILQAAYEGGINFFDTANAYSDSEEKIGRALCDVRGEIIIATKTMGQDRKTVLEHIENSLRIMKTDYIDLIQLHNPPNLPDSADLEGAYAGALEARRRGYVRHIGITSHSLTLSLEAISSGCYETLQYPFSYLSADSELALPGLCREAGLGFIAMKGLAGGLLTNPRACHAFMEEYPNVVPIWGVQTLGELGDWLDMAAENPRLDQALREEIKTDRAQLKEGFCRSCGYCMPCPAGIDIRNCARMNMLIRRAPWQDYYTDEWRGKMNRIRQCTGCGQCARKCPYGLEPESLLKRMLADYNAYYKERTGLSIF